MIEMWLIWLLVSLLAFSTILWRLKRKRERLIALFLIPFAPAIVFLLENRDIFDYAFFTTHAVFDLVVITMIAGILMLAASVYLAHLAILSLVYVLVVRNAGKRNDSERGA